MGVAVIMNLMNLSRLTEANQRRSLPGETVIWMEAVETNWEERREEVTVTMKTAITRDTRRRSREFQAQEKGKEDT